MDVLEFFSVLKDSFVLALYVTFYYLEHLWHMIFKPSMKSLQGEVILITGAANGIGKQICYFLADQGAKLVCWDIDKKANEDLVSELKESGCDAYEFTVDVSDRSQVETSAAEVRKRVGNVTILVNNAGIMPCKHFLQHTPQELENEFKINVFGNFWTLREFLPKMLENRKGHIVTLCSAAGLIPTRNLAAYCGTKHAIHGFIEGLRDDLRHSDKEADIKFTTAYPYSCNTGLLSGIQSHSKYTWLVPTVLEPKYVAKLVVDGMRMNYEYVYIPKFIKVASILDRLCTTKALVVSSEILKCFVEPTTPS